MSSCRKLPEKGMGVSIQMPIHMPENQEDGDGDQKRSWPALNIQAPKLNFPERICFQKVFLCQSKRKGSKNLKNGGSIILRFHGYCSEPVARKLYMTYIVLPSDR